MSNTPSWNPEQWVMNEEATIDTTPSWIREMRHGMELMKHACANNKEWRHCADCPFDTMCTMIYDQSRAQGLEYDTYEPDNWEIN